MLDAYAHEYEDLVRARDAHAIEIDTLRNSNRNLSTQVYVVRLLSWASILQSS